MNETEKKPETISPQLSKLEDTILKVIEEIVKEKPPKEAALTLSELVSFQFISYIIALIEERNSDTKKIKKISNQLKKLCRLRSGYISISMDINLDDDKILSTVEKEMFKSMCVGLTLAPLKSDTEFDILLPEDKGLRSIVFTETQKIIRSVMLFEMAFKRSHSTLYANAKSMLQCSDENIFNSAKEWFSLTCANDDKKKLMVNPYIFDSRNGHVFHKKNFAITECNL